MKLCCRTSRTWAHALQLSQFSQSALQQPQTAKMRAFMLYEERKHKRTKRIKSRRFRKIRQKALARYADAGQHSRQVMDYTCGTEPVKSVSRKRVEERFSLRHKNMSRWARSVLKRGQLYAPGIKEAIHASLRLGQKIRLRSMTGGGTSCETEEEEDVAIDTKDNTDISGVLQNAKCVYVATSKTAHVEGTLRQGQLGKSKHTGVLNETPVTTEPQNIEQSAAGRRLVMSPQEQSTTATGRMQKSDLQRVHLEARTLAADLRDRIIAPRTKQKQARNELVRKPSSGAIGDNLNPWIKQNPSNSIGGKHVQFGLGLQKFKVKGDAHAQQHRVRLASRAFAASTAKHAISKSQSSALAQRQNTRTIPGWGSWTYSRQKRNNCERNDGSNGKLDRSSIHMMQKCADRIVLSLQRNKMATQYLAAAVPHMSGNLKQHEQSMRTPLGAEWNSSAAHAQMTQPGALVDSGAVIGPISMPSGYKRKLAAINANFVQLQRAKRRRRVASRRSHI